MELQEFIENFASVFDDTDMSAFIPTAEFKEMEEWSSLIALSVIAMVDEEYDVHIGAKEIVGSRTIEDLFNVVKSL